VFGLSLFLSASFLVLGVQALMGVPHQFYGTVTINGKSAPDGFLIVARIGGVDVAGTSTLNGFYGYTPHIFYVQDPDSNRAGKTIGFYVSGIKAAEYKFKNGGHTGLNLAVTGNICGDTVCTSGESCSSCSRDCGTCPNNPPGGGSSGGGGGGSSGGSNIQQTSVVQEQPAPQQCVEDWTCTDWMDCINGVQKKFCVDYNRCGTELNKPEQSRKCDMPEEKPKAETQASSLGSLTGFMLTETATLWTFIIIVIAAIAAAGFYLSRRRR